MTSTTPKIQPTTGLGESQVREKATAYLRELIEKVNALFEGDLSENDKLVYVNEVIRGKLLENETLKQQATHNTKEQFASSPDLTNGVLDAIIDANDAHGLMSTQALNSEQVRESIKKILLQFGLYEALRQSAAQAPR